MLYSARVHAPDDEALTTLAVISKFQGRWHYLLICVGLKEDSDAFLPSLFGVPRGRSICPYLPAAFPQ